MSEERLQEIKDSINLQYKVQEANDLHSFNIFTDEEQELVEEIERLNNGYKLMEEALEDKTEEIERLNYIIIKVRNQLDYLETYSSKEDVFEDMKRRLDRIDKIVGSDKK